jgi:hypothetical protein
MRISRLVVVVVVMNEPSHGPHATLRSRPFTSLSSPNDVDVFSRSSSPVTGEREGERERGRERAGEGVFFPEPHVAVVPRTDLMFEVEAIA